MSNSILFNGDDMVEFAMLFMSSDVRNHKEEYKSGILDELKKFSERKKKKHEGDLHHTDNCLCVLCLLDGL